MADDIEAGGKPAEAAGKAPENHDDGWKAAARRWEDRAKRNLSELEAVKGELEELRKGLPEGGLAGVEAMRRRTDAMDAAVKGGVDWGRLSDSNKFLTELKSADDIPGLVGKYADEFRATPAAPAAAVAQPSTGGEAGIGDDEALGILLGDRGQ